MPETIKLSSPATGEFWEVPVLFSDDDLLVLNKPAGLSISPDPADPKRASLLQILHGDIERGAPWVKTSATTYLMHTHRIDAEASGALVLAKNKSASVNLTDQFNGAESHYLYFVLVRGAAGEEKFSCEEKIAPHPLRMGYMKIDADEGKRSRTDFAVTERFSHYSLLECRPVPDRLHQIRLHLKHLRLPVVGDPLYGCRQLFLSSVKPGYQSKPNQEERPMMGRPALHLSRVTFKHPHSGEQMELEAPFPKDFTVTLKYLRRFGLPGGLTSQSSAVSPSDSAGDFPPDQR